MYFHSSPEKPVSIVRRAARIHVPTLKYFPEAQFYLKKIYRYLGISLPLIQQDRKLVYYPVS